jgi:hypothetical protein
MLPKELSGNGSTHDQPGGEQNDREGRHERSIDGTEMKFILDRIRRM